MKKKPYKREINIGRNDKCFCGSGKKWKKCCGKKSNSDNGILVEITSNEKESSKLN